MEKKKRGGSITRRWVRGSLLLTILRAADCRGRVCLLYRQLLLLRCAHGDPDPGEYPDRQLSALSGVDDARRNASLRQMAEDFSEKDKFEFMLINTAGRVVSTSSGFVPDYLEQHGRF